MGDFPWEIARFFVVIVLVARCSESARRVLLVVGGSVEGAGDGHGAMVQCAFAGQCSKQNGRVIDWKRDDGAHRQVARAVYRSNRRMLAQPPLIERAARRAVSVNSQGKGALIVDATVERAGVVARVGIGRGFGARARENAGHKRLRARTRDQ